MMHIPITVAVRTIRTLKLCALYRSMDSNCYGMSTPVCKLLRVCVTMHIYVSKHMKKDCWPPL